MSYANNERERAILRLAVAMELTPEETDALLSRPSEWEVWEQMRLEAGERAARVVADLDLAALMRADEQKLIDAGGYAIETGVRYDADFLRSNPHYQRDATRAHERLTEYVQRTAAKQLLCGHGDLTAPLAEGEYVHLAKSCPEPGCDWLLPIEWRYETQIGVTRRRGLLETDALCRAHMEKHTG
ncbi:hypothetical protein [Nocardia asiatica]|uniref:hypothetical protein n=1 Tax=Nocardia asiatica TaxID=209252 RepID=UPI002457E54C|nr:hypothetical protein [Nocardia asiatica]